MAWDKETTGNRIIRLLKKADIEIQEDESVRLCTDGFARVCGFDCKSANALGERSFRVIVCQSWFRREGDHAKPSIKTSRVSFDFQLFPTRDYLFALYYLALRDYAIQLEQDRGKWFREPYWGTEISPQHGLFV